MPLWGKDPGCAPKNNRRHGTMPHKHPHTTSMPLRNHATPRLPQLRPSPSSRRQSSPARPHASVPDFSVRWPPGWLVRQAAGHNKDLVWRSAWSTKLVRPIRPAWLNLPGSAIGRCRGFSCAPPSGRSPAQAHMFQTRCRCCRRKPRCAAITERREIESTPQTNSHFLPQL